MKSWKGFERQAEKNADQILYKVREAQEQDEARSMLRVYLGKLAIRNANEYRAKGNDLQAFLIEQEYIEYIKEALQVL